MEPERAHIGLTDHPDLDVLVEALLHAGRMAVAESQLMFAIVMMMRATGEITLSGLCFLRSLASLEAVIVIEKTAKALVRDGSARAFGTCLNISDGCLYIPDEIPVLAVHVQHRAGEVVHVRQPYLIRSGGAIRYGQTRVICRESTSTN